MRVFHKHLQFITILLPTTLEVAQALAIGTEYPQIDN